MGKGMAAIRGVLSAREDVASDSTKRRMMAYTRVKDAHALTHIASAVEPKLILKVLQGGKANQILVHLVCWILFGSLVLLDVVLHANPNPSAI